MKLPIILTLLFLHGNTTTQATTPPTDTLNMKQQQIVLIAAFTAKGDLENLREVLHQGLDAGLTVNEAKEVLIQMYAYCGFPRSLNGLSTLLGVVKERQQKGIQDPTGKEASALPDNIDVLEAGTKVQTQLAGRPITGELYDFAPVIGTFLKSHLFGDIFLRDILDHQEREVATISALASMEGVGSQLRAHLNIGMNTGLTVAQLQYLISLLKIQVGSTEGNRAENELNSIINPK